MRKDRIAIAIDGPAASGKSSTAKAIAKELGFLHVDSGSLYRAATAARMRSLAKDRRWTEATVLDAARHVSLRPAETGFAALIGGQDADDEIRSPEVTQNVSQVAKMPALREWVNSQVRQVAREHDVVVDGRDIGTVVFPDAALKIFLVAEPGQRARRRLLERLGREPSENEVAEETGRIVNRDEMDADQSVMAPGAVVIDTTHLTQADQVSRIVEMVRALRR